MRLVLALSLILISGTTSAQDNQAARTQAALEGLLNLLGGPSIPNNCQTPTPKSCSYSDLCQSIQGNSITANLYQNSQGERLINPAMLSMTRSLMQCRQTLIASQDPVGAAAGPASFFQRNADFLRYVAGLPSEVQVQFNQVQVAMADISAEAASTYTMGMNMPDPATLIGAAQARSSIQLPAELNGRWIEHLRSMSPGIGGYTGGPPEMVPFDNMPAPLSELLDDPFSNPGVQTWAGVRGERGRQRWNERTAEFTQRALAIRDRVISFLETRAVAHPEQRPQLEAMKERIRTVNMVFGSPGEMSAGQNGCGQPNAFYSAQNHTVIVCPEMLATPMANLEYVFAHELGHAIDPCTMSGTLSSNMMPTGQTVWSVSTLQAPSFPGSVVVNPGVPYNENPFGSTLQCLAESDSLNAPPANQTTAESVVTEMRRLATAGQGDMRIVDAVQARIPQVFGRFQGCSVFPGSSRQQEAFGDWLAVEVVGNTSEAPNLTEITGFMSLGCPQPAAEALGGMVMSFLQENNCLSPQMAAQESFMSMLNPDQRVTGQLGAWSQALQDTHPAFADRVNKLMLQHPTLRAKLGCDTAPQGRYCAP